ncbi:MAG: hypothetical protein ABIV48_12405 [Pyrinomonadaceae bacterium]
MKVFILALIVFIGSAVIVEARSPESVTLRVGEKKSVDKGKLKISFLKVVEDSRCPTGATCIWAGNAKIRLSISIGRSDAKIIELNSNLDPQSIVAYGYEIKFGMLAPPPGESGNGKPAADVATILVQKSFKKTPARLSKPVS